MQLELTEDRRALLVKLLSSSLSETREEIYRTERFQYKAGIRAEKQFILEILAKLGHPLGEVSNKS